MHDHLLILIILQEMSHVENKIQTFHQVKCLISYIYETKVWILFKFGFRNKSKLLDLWRHTFATRCIENGMQPQVLKTILGHSSLAMTMDLYSHVLPDMKVDEMQKIAGLF